MPCSDRRLTREGMARHAGAHNKKPARRGVRAIDFQRQKGGAETRPPPRALFLSVPFDLLEVGIHDIFILGSRPRTRLLPRTARGAFGAGRLFVNGFGQFV